MKPFLDHNFLLNSKAAETLYHDYSKKMPIFDYHCHLPVEDIAADRGYENLTQIWLYGDHYKWRAMRANGVDETLITGKASDRDKFHAWAKTIPATLGNPLYHWSHLELQRYFGITDLLSASNADAVFAKTAELLNSGDFTVSRILEKSQVRGMCTTDDPLDSLTFHRQIAENPSMKVQVLPTFRPDKALNFGDPEALGTYLDRLEEASDSEISSFTTYIEALRSRHTYFHEAGCRLADHALVLPPYRPASEKTINILFTRVRGGETLNFEEVEILSTAALQEIARMHADRGWVMQLHIGALRNGNTRMYRQLGPDTGYDSIASNAIIAPLAGFFDSLEKESRLPKTIVYPLNPADFYPVASLLGSFQGQGIPGKMQLGSGWWFLDQKDGMEYQLKVLANIGLLSRFVGMLTDSRSFLSYPRHEYFRRILCNYLGSLVELGEIPDDYRLLGSMVEDISYHNIIKYIEIDA